jgi:formylglycine-generating enzyme required for sulfatase activity
MIAALETGFMAEAGSSWRIAEMRPGDRPISRLAQVLSTPQALGPEQAASAEEALFLESALRRGPLGLTEVLHETPLPAQTNLLLLVDQFEEIFRFREKGDPEDADAFVALLLGTSQQREAQMYVVITMRSDFLGDCTLFKGLPEAINESQYLTPRLIREQCRAAIVGPAKVCGGDVEPALVNRLLNDFGPDPDQLPLLQHALMRMWTRATDRASASGESANETLRAVPPSYIILTGRDYEELGGLSRALSDHADEVLKELTHLQRRIAEIMFRRLTERGVGKRDMRASAHLSDVAAVAGVSEADVTAVVETFRRPDRCFVTPRVGTLGPDTLLDIGHESLIRQWRLLGEWVEEEGRSALMYRRLNQTAQLWKAGDAALWRNPDLERALRWKDAQNPLPAWAVRYGSAEEFELAMEFLRASERAWSEERRLQEERKVQAEHEAARRRELEVAQRLAIAEAQRAQEAEKRASEQKEAASKLKRRAIAAAGAAAIALILLVVSIFMWHVAQEQRQLAESARNTAEEQRQLAESARNTAEEQQRLAESARSRAEEQQRLAESARNAAEEQRRLAETARANANALSLSIFDRATKEQPWVNSLGMKFVPVAGTQVLFSIWDTRVQDFRAFVDSTHYDATIGVEGSKAREATWNEPGFKQSPTDPVVGVSWIDAKAFCEWLTKRERDSDVLPEGMYYRLPTDEEWSIAAGLSDEAGSTPKEKDGKKKVYPWGTQWPPPKGAGNYSGEESKVRTSDFIKGYKDDYVYTSPVGSFAANQFGLYDMGGNVWQWCEDWYNSENKERVLRGASWTTFKHENVFSSCRDNVTPTVRRDRHGFRCVVARESSR